MGKFIAEQTVQHLSALDRPIKDLRVAVLGLTFKENVPDLRNSRVPDIIHELRDYGVHVMVHDPMADASEAEAEYGIALVAWRDMPKVDGIVVAVGHQAFVVIDVKGVIEPGSLPSHVRYWRLWQKTERLLL